MWTWSELAEVGVVKRKAQVSFRFEKSRKAFERNLVTSGVVDCHVTVAIFPAKIVEVFFETWILTMGASFVPFLIFTVLWGVVGIVLPIVAPKGPNRGWVIRFCIQLAYFLNPALSRFQHRPVCPDPNSSHLLVVLAVLLHGADEPADRSQAASEYHSDHGAWVGKFLCPRIGVLGSCGPLSGGSYGQQQRVPCHKGYNHSTAHVVVIIQERSLHHLSSGRVIVRH